MYNVLIVEDDPMVAMINEQYILRSGQFRVAGRCADGKSALNFLENNHTDLVILDVYIPHVSGIDMLKTLREKRIPVDVIMVTAANDRATLEEALRLGAVDYLVKPFAYDRFQEALEKFVAHAEALGGNEVLNQSSIDLILKSSGQKKESSYPKGIQGRTLAAILECMGGAESQWLTGDAIAEKIGLSGVTVRRYMNYLVEIGHAVAEMDYGTGGRPCLLYKCAKEP